MDTSGTATLFARAKAGDQAAWSELVERYSPLMRSIARRSGLPPDDVADIVQTTWLRVLQHLDGITDPRRLVGWLSTTVRRESWRVSGRRGRELPVAEGLDWRQDPDPGPELRVITDELEARVWQAVDALPERQRVLLRVLMSEDAPSYDEVAASLGMPVGSIGPTRARALRGLRRSTLLDEAVPAA